MKMDEYIRTEIDKGRRNFEIHFSYPSMEVSPDGLHIVRFKVGKKQKK